jgi:hypothetical protein
MTRTKAISVLMRICTDVVRTAALNFLVSELDAADDTADSLRKQIEYWKQQTAKAKETAV